MALGSRSMDAGAALVEARALLASINPDEIERDDHGRFAAKGTGVNSEPFNGPEPLAHKSDGAWISESGASGNCFPSAIHSAQALAAEGKANVQVVHGMPVYQGSDPQIPAGSRIWHAWAEYDMPVGEHAVRIVVDRSNGKDLEMPAQLYYKYGQMGEEHMTRYSIDDAYTKMLKSGDYGPWDGDPKLPS